ncbi:MAG: hypothetical protein M1812_001577 [Candelaria pacifica]|nr:MAG: hypothetical protein M1812_001577 [Candelaria pacifica]
MPAPLCPAKREVVDDALSRSVDQSAIALVVGISIRQVAKMRRNIAKYGASYKPREKKSGRPTKLNEGMEERPPRPPRKPYRFSRKPPADLTIQQQMPQLKLLELRPEYAVDPQLTEEGQTGQVQSEERTTLDHVAPQDERYIEGIREPLEEFHKGK